VGHVIKIFKTQYPWEKMQQKQQKCCVGCYGTKIYTRKLRKIYFTGQFSYMEVKCKH